MEELTSVARSSQKTCPDSADGIVLHFSPQVVSFF